MAIKTNLVSCPKCGADLSYEDGRTEMFCSYCGAKVIITNENEHIIRNVDEAGIKKAETERMIRLKELELEERQQQQRGHIRKILTYIWIGALIVIAIISLIIWLRGGTDAGFDAVSFLLYVGGAVGAGGAYLIFSVLPDKENEKVLLQNGGIRFPKSLEPFSEQNVDVVEQTLRSVGFRNISTVSMHDIKLGLLQKPGKVEKISVNGKEISSAGKVYMQNVPITITYHGR